MSRYILSCLLFVGSSVNAVFMLEIPATVENKSEKSVNIFTQASGPSVDRYSGGPGWNYGSWIESNIKPGTTREVKLHLFKESQALMKVFIVGTDEEEAISAQEMTGRYLKKNDYKYCGDITFFRDNNGKLKETHTGIDFALDERGSGQYVAKITVH